ncbi:MULTISPECIES: hypothetical protein [Pseudomonas]|uniref:hypothetical protein n=1 Tax=Pseudomonas TaxID=286 RepID=UPI000CD4E6A1|nr:MULTISPECIES: hypothetical protein [Pseudomonas]RBH59139.1 hypothetical protein C3F00_005070 [Pseudomonas sp. MWU13-2860]
MVTEDLELVKQIFALLESGIVNGYDAFRYEAEVFDGYMREQLSVEKNGVEVTDAERDFNGAILYRLLRELKNNAVKREEGWVVFVMSYRRGGEVKANFEY